MNRAQFHALAESYGVKVQRDDDFRAEDHVRWTTRNEAVQKYWFTPWSRNAAANWENEITLKAKELIRQGLLAQDWEKVKAAQAVLDRQIKPYEGFKNVRKIGGAALVFGAGPSLNKQWELLRNLPSGVKTVICNSVLRACLANGVRVDYCNTFDGQPNVGNDFEHVKAPDITFLASTAVHPNTVSAMRETGGRVIFYDKSSPGVDFFDYFLAAMYPVKRFGEIPTGGCVVNASAWLASQLFGFSPIGLVGVDFGFTDDGYRCKDYLPDEKGVWQEKPIPNNMGCKSLWTAENGIKHWEEHSVYRGVIESYQISGGLPLINCTEGGICENLPKMPLAVFLDRARQGLFDTKLI